MKSIPVDFIILEPYKIAIEYKKSKKWVFGKAGILSGF